MSAGPVIVADGTDKFGHRNADDSTALTNRLPELSGCGAGAPESVWSGAQCIFAVGYPWFGPE